MPISEFLIGSLLIVNAIDNFGLALIILMRGYRQPYARFFIGVLLFAAAWTVGDILVLYSPSLAVQGVARYIFYITPMGVPPCLWFFSQIFPEDSRLKKGRFILGSTFSLISMVFVWRFVDEIGRVHISRPMNELIPIQPGFVLYGLYLSVFFTLTYLTLFQKMKRSTGVANVQINYTFYSIAGASCMALISNVMLPALGLPGFIWLGPIFTFIGVTFITLAIIRYHLFDIRFFVVRATAYLVTLFLVAAVFVTPFILAASYIIGTTLNRGQVITAIIISIILLYSFQYLRSFFDKTTSAIFLRNYYSISDILNKLSDVLVHTGDLVSLRERTAVILENALNPQFVRYMLLIDQSDKGGELARLLNAYSNETQSEIVETDAIHAENNQALLNQMRENEIAIAVKLHTTHEDLGYIALGHKRSGELYSDRDQQLLSVAADEIAISLQNMLRYEEIKKFNLTLQEQISSATYKLRRNNQKLREMDETKDDFISMASHQLRTPLTSVKGYLSMVLEGDAGTINDLQRQMLQQAFDSSQRMVFLITDLLNISRLKTGKFIIEPAATDLSEVVDEEVKQLLPSAELKHISLTYERPQSFPTLLLDTTKIRQVIMNFIDNAIYYTPDGGHINVVLTNNATTVELRVTDNGIGVPRSEQHHLFTKFYRAGNARKMRPDGTGLGLFMAKKVVVAQGGSIIFSSKENEGSTFGFVFSKSALSVDRPTPVLEAPASKNKPTKPLAPVR